jgi:PAS domain S-box-containing protein
MLGPIEWTWNVIKWLNLYGRVRDCEIDRERLKIALAAKNDRIATLEARIELMESFLEIGTIEVDRQGNLLSANPVFAGLCGYSVEELKDFPLHDLLPMFLQRRHRVLFAQACLGKRKPPAIMLSELRCKDGTPQPVIVTICEIIHCSGTKFRADFRRR